MAKKPAKQTKKAVKTAAKKPAKTAKKAVKAAQTTVKEAAKQSTQSNVTPLPFINMETLTMKQQTQSYDKLMQEATATAQQQFDAFSQSASLFAKGFERIVKTCMDISQESTDQLAEGTKNLMACKTINEFAEAQNKLSQSYFEQWMGNATKLSEISIKVANESLAPLNDQVSKTIKKAAESAAA